jgi:hypothetical protein
MRLALATAFVLVVLPATTKGQSARIDALSLQAGVRARIFGPTTYPKYELITVASVSPDSLRYSLDSSLATKSLAWQQISQMDASTGRPRHAWGGAGIGLVVGAIAGSMLGSNAPGNEFRGIERILQGLLGGVVGALGGAVIGSAVRSDIWIPVTLPRTPVASSGTLINDSHPRSIGAFSPDFTTCVVEDACRSPRISLRGWQQAKRALPFGNARFRKSMQLPVL